MGMMPFIKYKPNDETWYDYVDRVITTALPYETRLDRFTTFKAEEWCRATLGPKWSIGFTAGVWTVRQDRFSFTEEKHLMWFQLRWQ